MIYSCFKWRGMVSFIVMTSLFLVSGVKSFGKGISLEPIGTYETGIFDDGAAEIVDYDSKNERLFVVNGADRAIDVLDISDPANPVFEFSIDLTSVGKKANSVAVFKNVVAACIENEDKQAPGIVAFFDTENGNLLNKVTVGALPDMLKFTPNGKYLLVANEGEPNDDYTIDPEGSVSVIKIKENFENIKQSDVQTADFAKFNNISLDQGIRIFGPSATVAQDLEPEFIAISANSKKAYITLQENNAVAVVDINEANVVDIFPLGTKDHSGNQEMSTHEFTNLPLLGTTEAGQDIFLGGFSGLYFKGINKSNGNYKFITHPDRGPNADTTNVDDDPDKERPFPLPDYQARWVHFEFNPSSGAIEITKQTFLRQSKMNKPITGLPNLIPGVLADPKFAYADEEPVDLFGNKLNNDPFGGDFEGIVCSDDGTYWMVDEYRPSIYHFNKSGKLIDRFVPEGSNASGIITGTEAIPAVYAQRRANRGFEAIAYDSGKIYAFIQSPIDNPDVGNDDNSKSSLNIRILEFDINSKTTTAEYLYILEGNGSDKIGDAVALGNGRFLVLERDSAIGNDTLKNIFHISTANATNLASLDPSIVGPGGTLEGMDINELLTEGINPVRKSIFCDLAKLGYDFADKPEGLALIDNNTIAVLNDNDFGLLGSFDINTGLLDPNPNPQIPTLAIIKFNRSALDASNKDDKINIVNWPVKGMYQPDAIATYKFRGLTYLITANEGDARDYDGFSEEDRVEDVTLDPGKFPDATDLQKEENLGRLKITNTLGDTDNDGDFDELYSYGARSFSIWSTDGKLIFDSGDEFEQLTANFIPDNFNSTNDENNSFDNRSDDKGPEPEGVAIGKIDGRRYAFIGLERVGGIMVYDITNPFDVSFIHYINNRDFNGDAAGLTAGDLGPEGILFISKEKSPINNPLLVVSNEVSGTTTIYLVIEKD